MGIIAKGTICNVTGCQNEGVRSLTTNKLDKSDLVVISHNKHVALCKIHYKEWKKNTKKKRMLELSRYNKY
ncbi:MAG: hypothetical protein KAF24_02910 [Nitrosopumilaceae archaeon]|nr:hypothetical protein [Nitrosopumilaceae archaeon]